MKVTAVVAMMILGLGASDAKRIVGGQPAEEDRHPYMVGLLNSPNGRPYCGGTLVEPDVVISAAHCPTPRFVQIGCNRVGASDCEIISVESDRAHPNYFSRPVPQNDHRIIFLDRASEYAPIGNVAGTSFENLPARTDVTVIGFGTTSSGGDVSDILLEVGVDVISNNECAQAYSAQGLPIDDSMICASAPGKDSCQGDSGGPLIIKCPNNADVLVGIVSWGIGCASPGFAGVYARTDSAVEDGFFSGLDISSPSVNDPCGGQPFGESTFTGVEEEQEDPNCFFGIFC